MEYEINNIYHADCYKAIKKIPDKSIDLIYTDIPYLIEHGGTGQSALAQRINKMVTEDLVEIKTGIDYSIFDEFVRVMKFIYLFIWCSKEQILDILNYFTKFEDVRYNVLVWCKTNPTPATNNVWLPDLEYCLVFKQKGCKRYNDGYVFKSKWYQSGINKKDKDLFEHPTIKPLELVKRHLQHACHDNFTVLDPFLGSGTTAVACKELGINYIGFEKDEKYYNIAKARLEGLTKQDREQQEKGQTSLFDFI